MWGGRPTEVCVAQHKETYPMSSATSSSSHGIACSGDSDGGDNNSNDYGGGGVDGDNGGGSIDINGNEHNNKQQSTKSRSGRLGSGGRGDTRITVAMTADGTMALIAAMTTTTAAAGATVTATAVEEGYGGGGARMDVLGVVRSWSPENRRSHLVISPNCKAPCF